MKIVNATKSVKTIMTDDGKLIAIGPGEVSSLMIASRNLIMSAKNLGTPDEIGIIIAGSYEFEIANSISAARAYLYTDEAEALSKLIDPTIDYKKNIDSSLAEVKLKDEIEKLNNKISDLETEKQDLLKQLTESSSKDLIKQLEDNIADLEDKLKTAQTDHLRVKGLFDEAQEKIKYDTDILNGLRKEVGEKSQELSESNRMINELSEKVKKLEESSKDTSALEAENAELKANLEQAANSIDSMKKSFNGACEKFGLYLDDNGEWQMETPTSAAE